MTISFKLSKPITHGKDTYTEFTLPEEPLVEHLFAMDAVQGETKKAVALFAAMAGVPLPVLGKMTLGDFGRMSKIMTPIMEQLAADEGDVGNAVAAGAGDSPASA